MFLQTIVTSGRFLLVHSGRALALRGVAFMGFAVEKNNCSWSPSLAKSLPAMPLR